MNEMGQGQWLSIIALMGWLALCFSAYRSHQVDTSKTVRMALTWIAIFAGLAILIGLVL